MRVRPWQWQHYSDPLGSRVQGFIDRRFYRRKVRRAAKTLEQFSQRLRDELNLESLTRELMDVINHTMGPSQVSVWLRASSTNDAALIGADAISQG
ncbi:MAG: hypothetical protein GEU78_04745 [Actinobacteria bacterium]|nr:hypothetical protein [Actinomycetota bacterium]